MTNYPAIEYSYWLIAKSRLVSLEYGLNDRRGFGDAEGKAHYYELPAAAYLQSGTNIAHLRLTPCPEVEMASKDVGSEAGGPENEAQATATLSLKIIRNADRKTTIIDFVKLKWDRKSEKFLSEPLEAQRLAPPLLSLAEPKALLGIAGEGKSDGFQVSFDLNDRFPPFPFENAKKLIITESLRTEVRKSLEDLLVLYRNRDVAAITAAYSLSWKHWAIALGYGSTAKDYAEGIKIANDIKDHTLEFVLDYREHELQLEAQGRLVGYQPPVLVGKEDDGWPALELPVFFMRDSHGTLVIAG
jgi:hypothetical protein